MVIHTQQTRDTHDTYRVRLFFISLGSYQVKNLFFLLAFGCLKLVNMQIRGGFNGGEEAKEKSLLYTEWEDMNAKYSFFCSTLHKLYSPFFS